jgi:hypothetical protein
MMVFEIVGFFIVGIVLMIMFHELGHYLEAKRLGVKAELKPFCVITESSESLDDEKQIIISGILFGIIPIALMFLLINHFNLLLIPLYVVGCRSDIKMLIDINDLKKLN